MGTRKILGAVTVFLTSTIGQGVSGQDCAWQSLGTGPQSPIVNAIAVGAGGEIYAGGSFAAIGGVAASNIAKREGQQWKPLGAGVNGTVFSLAIFDDGNGPRLYVGGSFSEAGNEEAENIAKWNGTQWSEVLGGTDGIVFALTPYRVGSTSTLAVGGAFDRAGNISAGRIALWNGSGWQSVGGGLESGFIFSLGVFDDGTGPGLYAGGLFTRAGGVMANNIARWDGTWHRVGNGTNGPVSALASALSGPIGPALYAGGSFSVAGGTSRPSIAAWDGDSWTSVGDGTDGSVTTIAVFNDGAGPAIFAGGSFSTAGLVSASNLAKWNGAQWSQVGGGTDGRVSALLPTISSVAGAQARLLVGGEFTKTGGATRAGIASWNCAGGCPTGEVEWVNPPSGVVDARRPHSPQSRQTLFGINQLEVTGPVGANSPECWTLCEASPGTTPNRVTQVVTRGVGQYTLQLLRPITAGAVTHVSYAAAQPNEPGLFTSHPGNVNADGFTNINDIASLTGILNGTVQAVWGSLSADINISGRVTSTDLIEAVDILNGGQAFDPWIGTPRPQPAAQCPSAAD